jgi:hypothetical protein
MGPIGPVPTAESQARELHPLRDDPAAVRRVWARAVDAAGEKQPTAATVKQARREYERERAERQQVRQERPPSASSRNGMPISPSTVTGRITCISRRMQRSSTAACNAHRQDHG